MSGKSSPTNGDIRDLIDRKFEDLRLELKGDIKDVASQVTALEKVVVNNEIKQAVSATKVGMLISGISVVVSGFTTIILGKIGGKM